MKKNPRDFIVCAGSSGDEPIVYPVPSDYKDSDLARQRANVHFACRLSYLLDRVDNYEAESAPSAVIAVKHGGKVYTIRFPGVDDSDDFAPYSYGIDLDDRELREKPEYSSPGKVYTSLHEKWLSERAKGELEFVDLNVQDSTLLVLEPDPELKEALKAIREARASRTGTP